MVDQHDGAELADLVPFFSTLGITVVSAAPESVVGRLGYDESLTTLGEDRLVAQVTQSQAVLTAP